MVIAVAVIATLFIYPKTEIAGKDLSTIIFSNRIMPWKLGLDIVGGTHLIYEVDLSTVSATDKQSVLSGLQSIMEKRVDAYGVSESSVVLSEAGGKTYLIVDLPGIKNAADAIGQIGKTAYLVFAEVQQTEVSGKTQTQLIPTELTGRYLTSARLTTDQFGQPQVALAFNSDGANLFSEITGRNIGKPLAIVVDGQLISSPKVDEQITGGNAVISGIKNLSEATNLANLLNAGALPAPVNLTSQSTIGATLGSAFLNKAIMAGALGTLLIILFISFYYRSLGILASLALLIYIVLTLGVYKGGGVTMSLSGIAGFILSIGMAVDANVLIFERTKEEMKKGLTFTSAIEEGFRRAWPSIRDSNTTTMITAVILYFTTSSFVQGFALTLGIGVLMSLFSSITVTRFLLRAFAKK